MLMCPVCGFSGIHVPEKEKKMPRQTVDLTGQYFGDLYVLERAPNRHKRPFWHCVCVCRNYTTVDGANLKSGRTRSCGCAKAENMRRIRRIPCKKK